MRCQTRRYLVVLSSFKDDVVAAYRREVRIIVVEAHVRCVLGYEFFNNEKICSIGEELGDEIGWFHCRHCR